MMLIEKDDQRRPRFERLRLGTRRDSANTGNVAQRRGYPLCV